MSSFIVFRDFNLQILTEKWYEHAVVAQAIYEQKRIKIPLLWNFNFRHLSTLFSITYTGNMWSVIHHSIHKMLTQIHEFTTSFISSFCSLLSILFCFSSFLSHSIYVNKDDDTAAEAAARTADKRTEEEKNGRMRYRNESERTNGTRPNYISRFVSTFNRNFSFSVHFFFYPHQK